MWKWDKHHIKDVKINADNIVEPRAVTMSINEMKMITQSQKVSDNKNDKDNERDVDEAWRQMDGISFAIMHAEKGELGW